MFRKLVLFVVVFLICCVQANGQADPNLVLSEVEGLVGYWNFDDGAVTDLSSFGNHGTLVGMAARIDASTCNKGYNYPQCHSLHDRFSLLICSCFMYLPSPFATSLTRRGEL
jgi:hypothetical protein